MTPGTTTPAATIEHFSELLEQGRLDAILDLYDDSAAFVAEPGRTVSGIEAIRTELERLAAMSPRMSGRVEQVIEAGDTALVAYRWTMEATSPDGTAIRQGGLSADVLRRRPDGSWSVIIDDPYGGARATLETDA
ncbi:MAG: nuclear transport factor 2 family protein [Gaiella sp.]|nr:nuclear transport factor 2 family protein [Gaiella sp.]